MMELNYKQQAILEDRIYALSSFLSVLKKLKFKSVKPLEKVGIYDTLKEFVERMEDEGVIYWVVQRKMA